MSRGESAKLLDRRAALVVVDVQNDFADPRGSRYVPGGAEVIAVINELVEDDRGAFVVDAQDAGVETH